MSSEFAINNASRVQAPPPVDTSGTTSAAAKNLLTDTKLARAAQVAASKMEPPKRTVQFNPDQMMKSMQEAVSFLNQQVASKQQGLGFAMDEVLGRPVITVRNTNTGEIVRQIPGDAVVKFAHNLEGLKGVLHNSSI
jgi:flagellar protein FlaG